MAKKVNFKKKASIKDTQGSNFGNYKTETGGGEPMGQGTKYPQGGRGTWSDNYDKKPKREAGQPRTDDGKFTYNSANGKGLAPTSQPGRGKTVNPLLTGGVNGIKIDDVESQFAKQSGQYWNKYKDTWYTKGSEKTTMSAGSHHKMDWHTKVSADSIWNIARQEFDVSKGELKGESKNWNESKKGARNKEEKLAHAQSQATNAEQYVMDAKTNGIKLKPGAVQPKPVQPNVAPQPAQPVKPTNPTPVIPTPQPSANAQTTISSATAQSVLNNAANKQNIQSVSPNFVKVSSKPANVPSQPKQLQDFSGDINLAKTNPKQFAIKYRNELGAMMPIIREKNPNFHTKQLIKLIGSGKLKSIDQLKELFKVK